MESKPFRSIFEQLEILKQRDLIVTDELSATQSLQHINYYRLSGYTLTLRTDDVFHKSITFDQVMQIYNFDAEFRVAILYALEYIEVSFRTHIGYHHAKQYGPLGYLNMSTFADEARYEKFYSEAVKLIEENDRNELFIKHHKDRYENTFPIWVIVEILSFGCLSRLFKNLHEDLKNEISSTYYSPINYSYIENWLQAFVVLRNICAHRGRLYNRYITFAPKLSKKDKDLFYGNSLNLNKVGKKVFTFIYVMNKVIKDNTVWNNLIDRIESLISKYPFVRISHYGFPENWEKFLPRR